MKPLIGFDFRRLHIIYEVNEMVAFKDMNLDMTVTNSPINRCFFRYWIFRRGKLIAYLNI